MHMKSRLRSTNLAGFYPVVEVGGGASAPKHPALLHGKRRGKKEKRREREREGGGKCVLCFWCYDILDKFKTH